MELEIKNTVILDVSVYTKLIEEHTIAVEAAKEQLSENKRLRNLCLALKKDLRGSEKEVEELQAKIDKKTELASFWFKKFQETDSELSRLEEKLAAISGEVSKE